MIDGYGRTIDYLRISITDRCNLRCIYCMPKDGIEFIPHEEVLTYEEILRLVRLFADSGIRKIKVTGGEPLVRKGISEFICQLKQVSGIQQVTLTTNGKLLGEKMEDLAEAGIDGINLSLDTLNPRVYEKITGAGCFSEVMNGFYAALRHWEIPLKINCVPLGVEGQDILQLAELAKAYPVCVRYIEMMPIGLGKQFDFFREELLQKELMKRYGEPVSVGKSMGNGPAHYISFKNFQGAIGFISAMSHGFCSSCNRLRLTAKGFLKTCLQYDDGIDLKVLLRGGASDEELFRAIQTAISEKPAGHQFSGGTLEHEETHLMAEIGG